MSKGRRANAELVSQETHPCGAYLVMVPQRMLESPL